MLRNVILDNSIKEHLVCASSLSVSNDIKEVPSPETCCAYLKLRSFTPTERCRFHDYCIKFVYFTLSIWNSYSLHDFPNVMMVFSLCYVVNTHYGNQNIDVMFNFFNRLHMMMAVLDRI